MKTPTNKKLTQRRKPMIGGNAKAKSNPDRSPVMAVAKDEELGRLAYEAFYSKAPMLPQWDELKTAVKIPWMRAGVIMVRYALYPETRNVKPVKWQLAGGDVAGGTRRNHGPEAPCYSAKRKWR